MGSSSILFGSLPAVIFTGRWTVLGPLWVVCLLIVILIPLQARRGKLHVPGYAGIMLGAGVLAFILGKLAGAEQLRGTVWRLVISILFYLLIATALGSFLSLLLFREPPQD